LFAYIGHFYGVNGVAMGTTIAFIANFFMLLFVARHYVGFSILTFFRDITIPVLFLIPFGIVLWLASSYIDIRFSDLLRCVIYTIIVVPTYLTLILKIRHKVFSDETSGLLDVIIEVVVNKIVKRKKRNG
jgi:PST family polysaccharide transporter